MNTVAEPRSPYHGMLQILHYNRPMYVRAVAVSLATILAVALLPIPRLLVVLALAGVAAGLLWSASSLLVSHWIYDRSPLSQWDWLARLLPAAPHHWASLHAGLDETFGALARIFPAEGGTVLDFYDPAEMTEPSIVRARRLSLDRTATPADFRALPLADASQDAIFLIFAAHELRRPDSRRRFFLEIARTLAPGGRAVLVEHLRDRQNFLAFGPGFLHFFPHREWLRLAASADLAVREDFRITPFVAVLVLEKHS
ncbi:MAG: hypothetical protein QOF89_3608 [Acidobacteriota bacterium]|jgi:SAM-dependent methyltransferase|nr:hypothetical protein [Acidobacteriota bacterium]